MIFNSTLDKSESLLDLGAEIGSDVVEELIRYVYTGKLEDIEEIADRVIVVAQKYGFPELKRICEAALIKQVRTDNAFNMYSLAVEVDAQNLRKKVFDLMKE
jgi:speckle-type POZ protein